MSVLSAIVLMASCSNNMQNNIPQYENQVIELPGVSNARQLGGYTIGDKKVRMDLLLRSGSLANASEEAVATLHDKYKLALIADFRTSTERKNAPDREVEGVKNIWLPVLENEYGAWDSSSQSTSSIHRNDDLSGTLAFLQLPAVKNVLAGIYDAMVFDADSRLSYAAFLDSLVALPEGRAALWHCTYGKDRCGWGTAFVLAALGADRSLIVEDFAMSNISYAKEIENLAAAARAEGVEEELIEYIHIIKGVSVAFFEKTLDAIDARYGSIDNFLEKELELSVEKRRNLQDKFLENR